LDRASRLFSGETPEDTVEFDVRWGDLSGVNRGEAAFDSGGCWALRRDSGALVFDIFSPLFGAAPIHSLRLEGDRRRGEVVLERSHFRDAESVDPLGFPLAELLINQRLARAGGVEFHGCGIRTGEGRGLLFVGHSGDGKTTTARLWDGRPGITILSDDRIIVRSEEGEEAHASPGPAGPPSPASGEGSRARAPLHLGERGGASSAGVRPFRMYGTPWHGEGQFAANADAPLSAIFILERGERTCAVPVAGAEAVSLLFARAFPPFYDAAAVDAVLETIDRIVERVPVYRFAFVPDETAVNGALEIAAGIAP